MASRNSFSSFTRRGFLRQAARASAGSLAVSSILRDLSLIGTASAQDRLGEFGDYKALVCIFLAGGNDSDNMIVSLPQYADYEQQRGVKLAIKYGGPAGENLLPVALNGITNNYLLHPSLAAGSGGTGIKTLFEEGKAAAVFNVGPLLEPIDADEFRSGLKLPPQLFSHSDQVMHWQTSIPEGPGDTGWAGRIANLFETGASESYHGKILLNTSISGSNVLQMGPLSNGYGLSTRGAIELAVLSGTNWSGGWRDALKNLANLPHANMQRTAYAKAITGAVAKGNLVNVALDSTVESNAYKTTGQLGNWSWNVAFPQTSLGSQLKMVARIIAARSALGMERQIFFVQLGGFDTHADQVKPYVAATQTSPSQGPHTGFHADLLKDLSDSVFAFQRAIEKLSLTDANLQKQVVSFTASDFGRTFRANGYGSDHGWGGHHFVFGGTGAVNGKQKFGDIPSYALGDSNSRDAGYGRWVPSISVDQYSATLAKWFGVGDDDLKTIFPNLTKFAPQDLGFLKPA